MKRREWLKGLFCAPLALLPSQQRASKGIIWTGVVEDMRQVDVTVQGSLIQESRLSDVVIKAINDARRGGRLS